MMTRKTSTLFMSAFLVAGLSGAAWADSTDNGVAGGSAVPPAGLVSDAIINFDSDPTGSVPNGFQSDDSDLVSFSASSGGNLQLGNYGSQSNGTNALGTFPDNQSFLIMQFATPMRSVTLDFGNDDPGFSNDGDEAEIRAFSGETLVGASQVVMNRNDVMDQSITFDAACFDRAEFQYNVTTNGLIEIVDNIDFVPCSNSTYFNVTKTFSDGNDAEVEVTLTCNSGLPLEQSFTIAGGDTDGVTFVVTNIPDAGADCEVTESGGPDGYTAVMNDGAGCAWPDVTAGFFRCLITNEANPATYTVVKDWVLEGTGGDIVDAVADVTITCDGAIEGETEDNGTWTKTGDLGDGDTLVAEVAVGTLADPTTCSASETITQSGVESEASGCGAVALGAGDSHTCTFTNTVFFEGIPTLSQWGMALMALLMLGVGFIGFRRIV